MKTHPMKENQIARLIIGSGSLVNIKNSDARTPSAADITINKDGAIKPTYQMDIRHLSNKRDILSKYVSHFSEVIFELVGDGLASLYTNTRDMQKNLKAIYRILQQNGRLVYEGFVCNAINTGILDSGSLDIGLVRTVDKAYQRMIDIKSTCFTQPHWKQDFKDRFVDLQEFHTDQLNKAGYRDIKFHVSKYDELERGELKATRWHIKCSATKT